MYFCKEALDEVNAENTDLSEIITTDVAHFVRDFDVAREIKTCVS